MASSEVFQKSPTPLYQQYRGSVLHNSEALSESQFDKVSPHFKGLRDDDLTSYYQKLSRVWTLVVLAAACSVLTLWGTLVASDWVAAG